MKISILQGTPPNLIGGGAILKEYDIWGENSKDIDITHYIIGDSNEFYYEYEANNRVLHNVREFTYNEQIAEELDENVIVLSFPSPKEFKTKKDLKKTLKYYKDLFKQHKERFKDRSNITVVCYDYKKSVVLDNIGARYPEILKNVDRVWVNNENNPLVFHLRENNFEKFYFGCPQFMSVSKTEWINHEDKYLSQIYFQGRNLDWKGWKSTTDLKRKLQKEGLDINLTYNGFINEEKFKVDTEFDSLFKRGFSKEILNEPEYFGAYSPESSKKLTAQSGFVIYFTDLNNQTNFFPEYALIDAIRAGSVVIVPNWYFEKSDKGEPIFNIDPSETGFLFWDPNSDESTQKLAKTISLLQKDYKQYELHRLKTLRFAYKYFGANDTILKAIGDKNVIKNIL